MRLELRALFPSSLAVAEGAWLSIEVRGAWQASKKWYRLPHGALHYVHAALP